MVCFLSTVVIKCNVHSLSEVDWRKLINTLNVFIFSVIKKREIKTPKINTSIFETDDLLRKNYVQYPSDCEEKYISKKSDIY